MNLTQIKHYIALAEREEAISLAIHALLPVEIQKRMERAEKKKRKHCGLTLEVLYLYKDELQRYGQAQDIIIRGED